MSESPTFEERLAHHPTLQQQFEEILRIVEAQDGHFRRADEAEFQVIESVRQLGHDALTAWANKRIEQEALGSKANPALRSHGQKNATGERPTE